jgi:Flp pilus assembly protein protease CpaA
MFALTPNVIIDASLVAITLVYAIFDIFNKRNVPTVFAYATLVVGVIFTLSTLNIMVIAESSVIAAVIFGLGYMLFKAGQLGAADVVELAAISMMLPIMQTPLLANTYQYGIPFIVSVFIATGIAALVMIPLYYIPRAASMLTDLLKGKSVKEVEKMGVRTVIDMLGIDPGPSRLKCATLSLKAAQKALFVYEKKDAASVSKEL